MKKEFNPTLLEIVIGDGVLDESIPSGENEDGGDNPENEIQGS